MDSFIRNVHIFACQIVINLKVYSVHFYIWTFLQTCKTHTARLSSIMHVNKPTHTRAIHTVTLLAFLACSDSEDKLLTGNRHSRHWLHCTLTSHSISLSCFLLLCVLSLSLSLSLCHILALTFFSLLSPAPVQSPSFSLTLTPSLRDRQTDLPCLQTELQSWQHSI